MAEKDRDDAPTLDELVAWLSAHPCNRAGADKSWVLHLMRRLERLFKSARVVDEPDGERER